MNFQQSNEWFIKNMLLKVWFQDNDAMPLLVEQTLAVFDDWLQSEILSALSKTQMEDFDKMIDQNPSDQDIYNFFNKSIQNFDGFMDWLYNKFEKMYISEYKKSLNK